MEFEHGLRVWGAACLLSLHFNTCSCCIGNMLYTICRRQRHCNVTQLYSNCDGWRGGGSGSVSGGGRTDGELKSLAHVGLSTGGNEWIARVMAEEVCVLLCRTDRRRHHVMHQTPVRPPSECEHLRPRRANLDGSAHFFPIEGPFAKRLT